MRSRRGTSVPRWCATSSAPSGQLVATVIEPDLFTEKRIAMTWTDFTFAEDYEAAGIDFGLAPWQVIKGSESFVDTWTARLGHLHRVEEFACGVDVLAVLGNRRPAYPRPGVFGPAALAQGRQDIDWAGGDPIREEYLKVLETAAKPQVWTPPLPEGAYDPAEIYNR